MPSVTTTWKRVSKRRPCPICGRPDWCGVSGDGQVAHCMRVESSHKTSTGGWIHRLTDDPPVTPVYRHKATSADPVKIDCEQIMARYRAETLPEDVRRLATDLGLTADSLRRLDVARAGPHRAWAFPMRAPDGLVGIRLRNDQADKWAITGSRQGLFIPDGHVGDQCDDVLVCEGPTDTAAMLDLGFYAVGRPACRGQEDMLIGLLYRRNIVILADRDEPKTRPDGTVWYPGQQGAAHLANLLIGKARTVKVVKPLKGKDARAWKRAGATRQIIETVITNAEYWRLQSG